MAYPETIKETGVLSQSNDVFDYFKGGLADLNNPEIWPLWNPSTGLFIDFFILSWTYVNPANINSRISFPMTRQQFYNWIDFWTITTDSGNSRVNETMHMFRTIHGAKLYQFADVQGNENWTKEAVIHWGKIKTLELAIFGSVGNGGSLTTNSIFTSGSVVSRVPEFTINSLNYLRYGLSRFENKESIASAPYGTCHPNEVIGPALTKIAEIPASRYIRFEMPSGVLLGDCEVSTSPNENFTPFFGTVTVVGSTVTWTVPAGNYPPGTISMRVRWSRGSYREAGPIITNSIHYT